MRFSLQAAALLGLIAALIVVVPPADRAAAESVSCTVQRVGPNAEISWNDSGGNHILRRNGSWLSTPGEGATLWVDVEAPAGASYLLRVRGDAPTEDVECVAGQTPDYPTGCSATVFAEHVQLSWNDSGGKHILRRNGSWLSTPDTGASMWVDTEPVPGSSYVLRTRDASVVDIPCTASDGPVVTPTPTPTGGDPVATPTPAPPPPAGDIERVLHVSIDALRSDHVTAATSPRLISLLGGGASTLNARTDYNLTKTLPNHVSQFTGRPVWGDDGHRVSFNEDRGGTVHQRAEQYIASVFDVVHDHGGATAIFANKEKFDYINRSWNQWHGARDTTGFDNGKDKIDVYKTNDPDLLVDDALDNLGNAQFTFFHIRLPDTTAHLYGWSGPQYDGAVRAADTILGELVDGILADPELATTTAIIVTSDHGGPNSGLLHDEPQVRTNYTVPMIVWGPGVAAGADLYDLNPTARKDPGNRRPGNGWSRQPIRTSEAANLALDLLDLPAVPGSVFNADMSLRVS